MCVSRFVPYRMTLTVHVTSLTYRVSRPIRCVFVCVCVRDVEAELYSPSLFALKEIVIPTTLARIPCHEGGSCTRIGTTIDENKIGIGNQNKYVRSVTTFTSLICTILIPGSSVRRYPSLRLHRRQHSNEKGT